MDPGPPNPVVDHPDALLLRLAELPSGDRNRAAVRSRVVEWYLPMAAYLAGRFAGRGEPLADLTQVAVIGLIKSVDRFDTTHGAPFASYAIPTIVGELKRHFRDTTWSVRVPRRLQELKLQLAKATDDLAQLLRRSPSTAELAARLGVTPQEVLLARAAATAYRPVSIHQHVPGHDDRYLIDLLPVTDHDIEAVDNRETLRVLLAELSSRERLVIHMRFYNDMTQAQIAAQIGVSQMHISRLLARSLTRLHDGMLAAAASPHALSTPAQREAARRLPAAASSSLFTRG